MINGIANPFCNQTLVQQQTAPTRTSFPTEQVRFSSHYWDKVSMNGRYTYSGGTSNVNQFRETFNGFLSRTTLRQEIDTGGLNDQRTPGPQQAHQRECRLRNRSGTQQITSPFPIRSTTGMFGCRATPFWSRISGTILPWCRAVRLLFRLQSLNVNTPLNNLHNYTTTTEAFGYLAHKNIGNTVMGILQRDARRQIVRRLALQ